jgi:hypothetical protein
MSILNGDDPNDMSEVFASLKELCPDDSEAESTPMTHKQIVELLTKERDYYREESQKDQQALKTIMGLCKQKGFDPFGEGSEPIAKPIANMSMDELFARNKEATARIEKTRHVDSKDKIPMPTYEEQAALYKEKPEISLFMELMDKSKAAEKDRVAKKAPKKSWWRMLFASSSEPHDPYSEHSSFGHHHED